MKQRKPRASHSTEHSGKSSWCIKKSGVQARLDQLRTRSFQPTRFALSLHATVSHLKPDRLALMWITGSVDLPGCCSATLQSPSLVAPRRGHRARILRPCLLAASVTGASPEPSSRS